MNYQDVAVRTEAYSTIVRVYPAAPITVYEAGTSTLVWQGNADAHGHFTVPNLTMGSYDIKINGVLYRTPEIVPIAYATKFSETWQVFVAGTINSDSGESSSIPIFIPDRAGTIERAQFLIQHIDATGDITAHILKGEANGSAALTVAADSAYNYQLNPGSEKYRYGDVGLPNISVAANEAVTVGYDYTAGTVEGLTVTMTFKPSE